MNWWIHSSSGETQGPFTISEIRGKISDRTVNSETLVCPEGQQVWGRATDDPNLSPIFAEPALSTASFAPKPDSAKLDRLEHLMIESLRLEARERKEGARLRRKKIAVAVILPVFATVFSFVILPYLSHGMFGSELPWNTLWGARPLIELMNEQELSEIALQIFRSEVTSPRPVTVRKIPGLKIESWNLPLGSGVDLDRIYYQANDTDARILIDIGDGLYRVIHRDLASGVTNRLDDGWPGSMEFSAEEKSFLVSSLQQRLVSAPASWIPEAMAGFGSGGVAGLLAILDNSSASEMSKTFAVQTLARIGPASEAAVPRLLKMIEGRRIEAGSEIGIKQVISQTKNLELAEAALHALGPIKSRPDIVVPALVDFLSDARDPTKIAAVNGLAEFGPAAAEAVPELMKLTGRDAAINLRIAVARALGKIGPQASPAVANLVEMLHEHEFLAQASMEAIVKIGKVPPALEDRLRGIIKDTETYPAVASGAFRALILIDANLDPKVLLPMAKPFIVRFRSEFETIAISVGQLHDTRTLPILITGLYWLTAEIGSNQYSIMPQVRSGHSENQAPSNSGGWSIILILRSSISWA